MHARGAALVHERITAPVQRTHQGRARRPPALSHGRRGARFERDRRVKPDDACLVITNLPDRDSAGRLAHALIEKRLAACINILSPCRSVYRWQGKTEDAEEFPMLIKTTSGRYAELEAAIRSGHPYELPEIIAVRLTGGLPAYLEWVDSETRPA